MRARDIKPRFYKNDQLAECSMAARLLFPGLWMLADREGRFENRPKKIKAEIFPFDDVDVASLLKELEDAELILAYEVNGSRYFWIPQFKKHQSPHKNEKNSEFPAHPDDLSGSESAQGRNEHPITPEKDRSTPVIPGKIPLTPSSLTPEDFKTLTTFESLSPPDGGDAPQPAEKELPEAPEQPEAKAPPCPYEAIRALYHEILPEHPRVEIVNEKRQRAMKARWADIGKRLKAKRQRDGPEERLAYLRRFFGRASESDFLTGKKAFRDGSVYIADFDKLMSPSGFVGVIEGKYDNRERW